MTIEPNKQNENDNKTKINIDHLTLRKYLGILGILLPFVLIIGNGFHVENSISHYYYSNMSVVFTGTLVAFGFFLISYRGYVKKEDELLSDNLITNFAGVLAFIVALVPTACELCSITPNDCELCMNAVSLPNGHIDNSLKQGIHLASAGLFIIIMGFMSFNQFVKHGNLKDLPDEEMKTYLKRKRLYKTCGIVIWSVIVVLLLDRLLNLPFPETITFWGETVALLCFGTAWLVKSESLKRVGM